MRQKIKLESQEDAVLQERERQQKLWRNSCWYLGGCFVALGTVAIFLGHPLIACGCLAISFVAIRWGVDLW